MKKKKKGIKASRLGYLRELLFLPQSISLVYEAYMLINFC